MTRIFTTVVPEFLFCLCLAIASPAIAQGFDDRAGQGRDDSWNYQNNNGYAPNPRAIIRQRAMERAAHRQARLEAQAYSGNYRMRPRVNPTLLMVTTWPPNYVYGPPLVANNNWGDTQISVLGEGNRAATRGIVSRRARAADDTGSYAPRW